MFVSQLQLIFHVKGKKGWILGLMVDTSIIWAGCEKGWTKRVNFT